MSTQRPQGLTYLPTDVVQLIAKFLLPYDVLALSKTCRVLKPILLERSVWLQIAESVSQSRPLPYTAAQALDLPIKDLILSCLRAQRIARCWAGPVIRPRSQPVKISFPDYRVVSYFTFLPGSHHLMIYDMYNVMSCWTTKGEHLKSWRVAHGAKLTRWKPCDESENNYDYNRRMQAVEIMIEFPGRSRPTRCEIILLVYSGGYAKFEPVASFRVPGIYEPFSAMTQDELRGTLVGIPSNVTRDHVGIYLTDRNTDKAICIDTELPLVFDCVPQALLSSSHMVLYWETLSGAHYVSYEISVLRDAIAYGGRSQDDPSLSWPVTILPSDRRDVPFVTVRANGAQSSGVECEDCGAPMTELPSTDLSRNRDAYPVIIPKWTTLREDLRRHRTRSVLTLSRRPPPSSVGAYTGQPAAHVIQDHQAHAAAMVALQVQAMQTLGLMGPGGGLGLHLGDAVPNANQAAAPAQPAPPHNLPNQPHPHVHVHPPHGHGNAYHHFPPPPPRTTITHHYFDYCGAGSGPSTLTRTVIAEVTLRRPQSLRLPIPAVLHMDHMHDNEAENEGFGVEHFGGIGDMEGFQDENEDDEDDEPGALHFIDPDDGGPGALHFIDPDDDPGELGEAIGALQNGVDGLQLNLDDAPAPPINFAEGLVELQPLGAAAAHALADFVQDPFCGSPVMGYGGRCALWVEERPQYHRAGDREPVLRVATFPTYEPPPERFGDMRGEVYVHPELEEARGRVCTLHVPGVPLDSAYTFDLDDVRGLVGIATAYGEVWLFDCS
ncbi:hypothetical protein M0805_002504 [Coniferiporia weirii]|nr:hypothetical protein M0805_002504 [Coniferiporia weirii]